MRTLTQAIEKIAALVPLDRIQSVDATLCEDFASVMIYCHFGNDDLIAVFCDLAAPANPATFDPTPYAEAVLARSRPLN